MNGTKRAIKEIDFARKVLPNVETVRHILTARIDHASDQSAYIAYCSARDIFEYFLAGNTEVLQQFDYLLTKEECGLE